MKKFIFLADPNIPINNRFAELHKYKVYLIVRLTLQ